jgi:hypothetical protein
MGLLIVATSLISAIFDRAWLLIDVGVLVVFGFVHFQAWPSYTDAQKTAMDAYKKDAQEGIRSAATGGVAVAGILVPLSILTVSLVADKRGGLPTGVEVDFFMAAVWLFLSLLAGTAVLYYVGLRGYVKNVLTSRGLGMSYGFQLLFLAVGTFRLVFGMYGLVDHLI